MASGTNRGKGRKGKKPDQANEEARKRLAESWGGDGPGGTGAPKPPPGPAPLPLPPIGASRAPGGLPPLAGGNPGRSSGGPAPVPPLASVAETSRVTPLRAVDPSAQNVEPIDGVRERRPRSSAVAEDESDGIERDRKHLAVALSWSVVAFVWAFLVTWVNGTNAETSSDLGPGPFPVAMVSIGFAWAISALSSVLGRYWYLWYGIPIALLIAGPPLYQAYWGGTVRDATVGYLSAAGSSADVDIDPQTATSAPINTPEGCFDVVRKLGTHETTVNVVTYQPQTARQQADYALTPRFAKSVPPGGAGVTTRQFVFRNGKGPPQILLPQIDATSCRKSGTP